MELLLVMDVVITVKVIAQGSLQQLAGASEFSNPGIQERWSRLMIDHEAQAGQTEASPGKTFGRYCWRRKYG